MEVTTSYPVYIDGKRVGKVDNNYLYAAGDEPTDKEKQDKAKSEGKIWDKAAGAWRKMTQDEASRFNKLRASGAFGVLGQLLGLTAPVTAPTTTTTTTLIEEDKDKKKKLTTTQWVLIGVGVLAVGGLIFALTRKTGK